MPGRMKPFLLSFIVLILWVAVAYPQTPPEVGAEAPDFALRDPSGKVYELSEFRGNKIVILEFFRSGDW